MTRKFLNLSSMFSRAATRPSFTGKARSLSCLQHYPPAPPQRTPSTEPPPAAGVGGRRLGDDRGKLHRAGGKRHPTPPSHRHHAWGRAGSTPPAGPGDPQGSRRPRLTVAPGGGGEGGTEHATSPRPLPARTSQTRLLCTFN